MSVEPKQIQIVAFFSYFQLSQIQSAILSAPYYNSFTNTSGALRALAREQYTYSNGERAGVTHMGVLVTDGQDNVENQLASSVNEVVQEGINMLAFGISSEVDENELRSIVSQPASMGGNYWIVSDFVSLNNYVDTLATGICTYSTTDAGKTTSLLRRNNVATF